jgi:HD-GYP domain-containing protein (c-di-GMP phosphodiesterase class II)
VHDFVAEKAKEYLAHIDPAFNYDDLPSIDFEQAEAALHLEERLKLLTEIGLALSSVRDIKQLVNLILSKARELTGADAGSLYLVNTSGTDCADDDTLYFCDAQNDSIHVDTSHTFPVSSSSLAGYVALSGRTLCFEDVYHLPADAPYQFNPSFDKAHGYRTKSVLVVPMRDHNNKMLGVLQLINRKRHKDAKLTDETVVNAEVLPFDGTLPEMAASLASQAAVAIENSRFVENIRELFESFVTASASAIEDRDPCTSGHSRRVTQLTLAMASAAHFSTTGPFSDTRFTPVEMKTLAYAGLLHDFGKIGVPEYVLTKSHKLDPARFERIKGRVFSLRQERRAHFHNEMVLALRLHFGRNESRTLVEEKCAALEAQLNAELEEFDALLAMLIKTNDPAVTFLPDEEYARQQELLQRLSEMTYEDEKGKRQPILDEDDILALSIRKGSLTPDEFRAIQNHAQLSYEFLKKIRWTDEFARIPEIAWGHHEKLNGKGYPRGVLASEISLETRLMTVADIYDALTANDRPYKKAMPVDRAIEILCKEAGFGDLDQDVVDLFVANAVYKDPQVWIKRFDPSLIPLLYPVE